MVYCNINNNNNKKRDAYEKSYEFFDIFEQVDKAWEWVLIPSDHCYINEYNLRHGDGITAENHQIILGAGSHQV